MAFKIQFDVRMHCIERIQFSSCNSNNFTPFAMVSFGLLMESNLTNCVLAWKCVGEPAAGERVVWKESLPLG